MDLITNSLIFEDQSMTDKIEFTTTQLIEIFLLSWFLYWYCIARFVHSLKIEFKDKSVEDDFINRIVSATHGSIVFIIAVYDQLTSKMDYDTPNSILQSRLIYFSVCYFVYDVVAMRYYKVSDIHIESHHFCAILAYLAIICTGYGGKFIAMALVITEVSNGVMHFRKLCDLSGLRYTKLRNLFQNLYFFLYISFRSIGGLKLFTIWYLNSNMPYQVAVAIIYLWVQSITTFPTMIGIYKKELALKEELQSLGADKWWFSENPIISIKKHLLKKSKLDSKVFQN